MIKHVMQVPSVSKALFKIFKI